MGPMDVRVRECPLRERLASLQAAGEQKRTQTDKDAITNIQTYQVHGTKLWPQLLFL